jgi:hypothetical protein
MIKYPKCLICGHSKTQHHFERCMDCWLHNELKIAEMHNAYILYGEEKITVDNLAVPHSYVPDNLGYIEKLAKARKLI